MFNISVANARTCGLETTIVSLLGPKMLRDDTHVPYVPVCSASAQYVPVCSMCQCAVCTSVQYVPVSSSIYSNSPSPVLKFWYSSVVCKR